MRKFNMFTKKIVASASILLLGMSVTSNAELLVSEGFEAGDFSGWTTFGEGWRIGGGGDANTGAFGAVNDVLTSHTSVFRGVQQTVAATAGDLYTFSAFIAGVTVDQSSAFLEMNFLDGSGGVIASATSAPITMDQPFTQVSIVEATAPVGTVQVRAGAIVLASGIDNTTQSDADFLIFDDFSLTVPEPASIALLGVGVACMLGRKRS